MNNPKELLKFAMILKDLSNEAFKELGSGFKEDTFQKALAICFRQRNIDYLKETNIEIFFKNESLGGFRLVFLIPPQKNKSFNLIKAVVIETKVSSGIKNPARLQLKNYLESLPKNKSKAFKDVSEGFIINWHDGVDAKEKHSDGVDIELWHVKQKRFKEVELNF